MNTKSLHHNCSNFNRNLIEYPHSVKYVVDFESHILCDNVGESKEKPRKFLFSIAQGQKLGNWFVWGKSPRARIFDRDHGSVKDLNSLTALMRLASQQFFSTPQSLSLLKTIPSFFKIVFRFTTNSFQINSKTKPTETKIQIDSSKNVSYLISESFSCKINYHFKEAVQHRVMPSCRYNDYKNDPFSRCNCTPPYSAEAGYYLFMGLNNKFFSPFSARDKTFFFSRNCNQLFLVICIFFREDVFMLKNGPNSIAPKTSAFLWFFESIRNQERNSTIDQIRYSTSTQKYFY